jgi:hypothetical protein
LRALFFFFILAKTQRNSGPLGLTSGGLVGFATLRAIHFFFIIHAKPAYRQAGHRDLPAKVGAKKLWLLSK